LLYRCIWPEKINKIFSTINPIKGKIQDDFYL